MERKKAKQRKNNKSRGVTLVVLAITIVVLIVLGTVSINAIFGEKGTLEQAEIKKDMTSNSTTKDEEELNIVMAEFENQLVGGESEEFEIPGNWNLEKVIPVLSVDKECVPVPKGYVASTIEGEKSVNTGFVIKEGTNGNATQGINEFVWIPVRNISDIYDEANNAGQLWDFGGTTSIKRQYPSTQNYGYREPDIATGSSGIEYDAVSSNLKEAGLSSTITVGDFKTQLQNEFNSMIESVKKYGGFYIGRYETGDLSKEKAVVQNGNTDISDQTWYTMYRLSKTIGANNNVKTSMIWGCQWDATLRWMQNDGTIDISIMIGNYVDQYISYVDTDGITKTASGIKIPTGSAEITKVNNIYDMAGNIEEYTIEACNNDGRACRGGDYPSESTSDRVYDRYSYNLSSYYNGSRATLYISI